MDYTAFDGADQEPLRLCECEVATGSPGLSCDKEGCELRAWDLLLLGVCTLTEALFSEAHITRGIDFELRIIITAIFCTVDTETSESQVLRQRLPTRGAVAGWGRTSAAVKSPVLQALLAICSQQLASSRSRGQ